MEISEEVQALMDESHKDNMARALIQDDISNVRDLIVSLMMAHEGRHVLMDAGGSDSVVYEVSRVPNQNNVFRVRYQTGDMEDHDMAMRTVDLIVVPRPDMNGVPD